MTYQRNETPEPLASNTIPDALKAIEKIATEAKLFLTVTTTDEGEVVAVSWQDEEHRVHQVLWEKE